MSDEWTLSWGQAVDGPGIAYDERIPVIRRSRYDEALAEIAKLREALKLVTYADRSRGYPTPKEWDEVVSVARAAMEGK